MLKRISRDEVLARLGAEREAKRPIIAAGCSAGIIAKAAEHGGADLVIVYSTGRSRMMGLPTTRIGHANPMTRAMCEELENVMTQTPLVAGIEATDPTYLDLDRTLDTWLTGGTSGVINFPTLGIMPDYEKTRAAVGLGFAREAEMLTLARSRGLFTMAYVFDPQQARIMADAGADCVVAHVGPTVGGSVGFSSSRSVEAMADSVNAILGAARKVSPEVFRLAHGGHFAEPEDTHLLYELTDAEGFVGASSIERIPVERAVSETVSAFKKIGLPR